MASTRPSDALPRVWVRLPHDIKDWILTEARRNSATQNSEIVRRLRAAKDQETANAR